MQIKNSIAFVTGANRGIGKALVEALLEVGAQKVYAAARQLESLDAVASVDRTRVARIQTDVTDRPRIATLSKEAPDVNLLINNAGVLDFGSILEVPLDTVAREFETNFYGKLMLARAFAPVIEKNGGGAIVNMLTLVALASMPGLGVYNATKAAAWSMTQSLRGSLAGNGVAVHGVFPGAVDTEMLAGVDMPKTSAADVARAIFAGIEAGDEDIFPDPMSSQMYEAWKNDHKAVEKQFSTM